MTMGKEKSDMEGYQDVSGEKAQGEKKFTRSEKARGQGKTFCVLDQNWGIGVKEGPPVRKGNSTRGAQMVARNAITM